MYPTEYSPAKIHKPDATRPKIAPSGVTAKLIAKPSAICATKRLGVSPAWTARATCNAAIKVTTPPIGPATSRQTGRFAKNGVRHATTNGAKIPTSSAVCGIITGHLPEAPPPPRAMRPPTSWHQPQTRYSPMLRSIEGHRLPGFRLDLAPLTGLVAST